MISERYWRPVYAYLRAEGNGKQDAEDLAQGFFTEIVWAKNLPGQADRDKGRFRNFLLAALDNYVHGEHRKATAQIRSPKEGLISLDAFDPGKAPEPVTGGTPDQEFMYTWASSLLEEVLDQVQCECNAKGQEIHWALFDARLLQPTLHGTEPVPREDHQRMYGLSSENDVTNMVVTVERKFKRILRAVMKAYVRSERNIDQEITDLIEILRKFRAGS